MPKITLEEFFSGDVTKVIECTTREQSDAVREAFHSLGKTWMSGDSYLDLDYWEDGDTYIHYTNDGCQGKDEPMRSWLVCSFDDIIEFSSKPIPEPDPHQLRVLLRSDYKWYDARWDGRTKFLSINKNHLNAVEIVAIENDPRTKYVQCTKCHSIIKNTKKALREHARLGLSSKSCLTCKQLGSRNETTLKESLVKNDDGTYTRTKKTVCSLVCDNSWSHPSIESATARQCCIYSRCHEQSVARIEDFFIKYPGAFDEMATVDTLDMSKWDVDYKYSDNSVRLKRKGRYSMYAHITNLGIIDRLECHYRSCTYRIVYSKKYDKMFAIMYGEYKELIAANQIFSTQYYNELMKIMRNIYKGED